jgi:hypothetical protein
MGGENTKSLKRLFSLIAFAVSSQLLMACGAKQHPPEAYEAQASLRKVQAATQVGVNYQQYGQLLIEAKDKTNAASRVLPDGPLKDEIHATMNAYTDAGQVWGIKIRPDPNPANQGYVVSTGELGRTLISKYSLKPAALASWRSHCQDPVARATSTATCVRPPTLPPAS